MIVDKVFLGFAIVGGALFCARLILFFVSGFGDVDTDADVDVDVDMDVDVDVDGDVGDADGALTDSDVSFRVFTFQAITAFFMMFGLVGWAMRKESQVRPAAAIGGAMLAGVFSMWLIAKVVSMMRGLQSRGTISMRNAIGERGSVYLTISAGGTGKARITVQGRLLVLNAVAKSGEEIKTGAHVQVVDLTADNVLVVEKL